MIRGFHHAAICTPDLERSLHFYRDLVALEVLSEGGWESGWDVADRITDLKGTAARWVMLSAGNANLELFQYESPPGLRQDPDRPVNDPGITHICLEVTGLQAMYDRLVAAGVRFHCPPQDQGDIGWATYGRDPDGNVVELLEYPDPDHVEALKL
jgi:catechol 2,3-dioxygenase-like lactoylglutathione lyase family enzyme